MRKNAHLQKKFENGKIIHRGGNQQPAVLINPKLDKKSLFLLVPQSEKIHSFAARMRALLSMMENEKGKRETTPPHTKSGHSWSWNKQSKSIP